MWHACHSRALFGRQCPSSRGSVCSSIPRREIYVLCFPCILKRTFLCVFATLFYNLLFSLFCCCCCCFFPVHQPEEKTVGAKAETNVVKFGWIKGVLVRWSVSVSLLLSFDGCLKYLFIMITVYSTFGE